ncbi:MAG: DUF72 domain-containing protein [Agriterribacter sp.]
MKKAAIYIGTSGWQYAHWKKRFYPDKLSTKDQLSYYATKLSTVEVNNSFYATPVKQHLQKWAATVPETFLFAIKVNRYFTHLKKLHTTKAEITQFVKLVSHLGNKLGPLLLQLPPRWKVNIERLKTFLDTLPPKHRYVFEFRNDTWHTQEVYDLLQKHNCALCIYELEHYISPLVLTADFVYIRLHGPAQKYRGSYSAATLGKWAKNCRKWLQQKKDVYVYFDNDEKAFAPANALQLIEKV